tara:strand:+ start:276 stop:611 length:336 start_codon:yes stop_codon:yes gene_type:complete
MIPSSTILRNSLIVRRDIGEFAYTASQIREMLTYAFEDAGGAKLPNSDQIRKYAIANQLIVESSDFGLNTEKTRIRYWIPRFCFGDIISGFDLAVSVNDLENAIYNLGFQY